MKNRFEITGVEMPKNKNVRGNNDVLLRYLDCSVIKYLHYLNRKNKERQFASVRGAFVEGNRIYENAGIFEKTHIQVCIINPHCVKGYFRPLEINEE